MTGVPTSATSLKDAEMLQHNAGWVAVLDGDTFVGVLRPASLHSALRRSIALAQHEPAKEAVWQA